MSALGVTRRYRRWVRLCARRLTSCRSASSVTMAASVTTLLLLVFLPSLLLNVWRGSPLDSAPIGQISDLQEPREVPTGSGPLQGLNAKALVVGKRDQQLVSRARQAAELPQGSGRTLGPTNTSLLRSPDGRYYVTVLPQGRLGNQMFEYASLLGIADVNRRVPFVTSACKVTHYFVNVSVSDRPVSGWTIVEELNYAEKDDIFDELPPRNVKIRGFLQSWKYFSSVSETVRQAFRFLPDVDEVVQAFYRNATGSEPKDSGGGSDVIVRIGVHVRRTDMQHRLARGQGYVTAPASYLRRAIRHMRERFRDRRCLFYVVSDDPDWCQERLGSGGGGPGVLVLGAAPAVVHLGFLALCDHVIMTVGTFGWWGAFLSRGHVVYYRGFPRNGSQIADGFRREDFFPPHWVGIGD